VVVNHIWEFGSVIIRALVSAFTDGRSEID
jgi:hypothetical protein